MRALVVVCFFVAASLVRPAAAQELRAPKARQGIYLGGGLRTGVSRAEDENIGRLGTLTHFGALLRFGQMTFPHVGVGVAFLGGGEANDDWSLGYGGLLLEGQWQPVDDIDLALRLSVGVAGGSVSRLDETEAESDDPENLFGTMYVLGLSYDWFPFYEKGQPDSGDPAFTFFVEGRAFPAGDVTTFGGFFGVEFTWWTGLDRRKLALPLEEAF